MENVTDFLERAASIFMFCLAGTLFMFSTRELGSVISATKNSVSNQNTLYEQPLDEIKQGQVTYGELIATLFGEIDYDIQINQITIHKTDYNYQVFDFSLVPQGEYTKTYEYDTEGNIVKVIYTS